MNRSARIDALYKSFNQATVQHVKIEDERIIIHGSEKDKVYVPSATGQRFHHDNTFVRLIMGPYGSGKTTTCLTEIVRRACHMPFWDRGRQRTSRWAIVRNTSGELYSTTLKSWLDWFGELGVVTKRQKPVLTYNHQFNDGKGLVNLELIFIALDREDDLRKIKSLEVTGCYINELSEVPQGTLMHFKGRLNGRYPSASSCPDPYWSGIICDTNPPDIDHWIHRDFEEDPIDKHKIFHQPPGLLKNEDGEWYQNPECDNYAHMSPSYYINLIGRNNEDFVKVYCLGEYGLVTNDKLVFTDFNSDYHITDKLDIIQGDPIHLGWDFGLMPACVVIQPTPDGRIKVLKEYQGEDIGIRNFAKNIVLPSLQRDFPYNKIGISRADPSGSASDTIMEELSCIGELNSIGINTAPANTNDLEPRLGAVRYFLTNMMGGKPSISFYRPWCSGLIKGFQKDYIFKRINVSGEERYKEIPHKNAASHRQDALQYILLEFAADIILSRKTKENKVDMWNPVLRIF